MAFRLRQCTRRLPRVPDAGGSPCALSDMGRCGAPCIGGQDQQEYGAVVAQVRHAMLVDPGPVVQAHAARIATLTAAERFEEAAEWRDRLDAFLRGAARAQRSRRIARHAQIVAARPHERGAWEVVVVRHGRLCATVTTPPGADPRPTIEALLATAEEAATPTLPASAASPEETDLVLQWLEQPGVRLVEVGEGWACPVRGAEAYRNRGGDGSGLAAALRRMAGQGTIDGTSHALVAVGDASGPVADAEAHSAA